MRASCPPTAREFPPRSSLVLALELLPSAFASDAFTLTHRWPRLTAMVTLMPCATPNPDKAAQPVTLPMKLQWAFRFPSDPFDEMDEPTPDCGTTAECDRSASELPTLSALPVSRASEPNAKTHRFRPHKIINLKLIYISL